MVYRAFSLNARIRQVPDLDEYNAEFQSLTTLEPNANNLRIGAIFVGAASSRD